MMRAILRAARVPCPSRARCQCSAAGDENKGFQIKKNNRSQPGSAADGASNNLISSMSGALSSAVFAARPVRCNAG